jgi:hypothetical protein
MSVLNIFSQDAFSVMRLTDALREIKYTPSRIGQLGLFSVQNVDTLDIGIEKDKEQNIMLVQASPRGGPGQTFGRSKRSMRMLKVPHFQVDDAIYADEVQQVRAFGQEMAVERLQEKIAERAAEASQFFALTEEFHRLNIIKTGKLFDADGTSVLYDYFSEFGESQPTEIDFDLDNATPAEGALRKKCASITRQMGQILDGLPFTGIRVLCGDAFFDDLIAHKEVRDTYKGYEQAATLRTAYVNSGQSGTYGAFEFGGITFENYRGGQNIGIDPNKCHLFPEGVPGLFRTVYAPADYIETVNRPGQRLYAKQWEMQNGKGVNLEFQMNTLHYCTRPRVLIPGKRT